MKYKKLIMAIKGQENGHSYKYSRIAYAAGFPIEFSTDLTEAQFAKFVDYGLSREEIERFEVTGRL